LNIGKQYSTKVITKRVDIGNVKQIEEWLLLALEEFGRLDGAANIAGIALGDGQITENIASYLFLGK